MVCYPSQPPYKLLAFSNPPIMSKLLALFGSGDSFSDGWMELIDSTCNTFDGGAGPWPGKDFTLESESMQFLKSSYGNKYTRDSQS